MMRNADGKLPVITQPAESGCGCDRRTLLGGLAVGALAVGCRIDDPGIDNMTPDAGPLPDGTTGTGFETCGSGNVCVDLTHPLNMNLNTVGLSRVIQQGTQKIIIARTSDNEFVTMSAICTHSGCTVRYAMAASQMQCPCHGSKFGLDGTVAMGPANRDLNVFDNDFDQAGNLLTITLA